MKKILSFVGELIKEIIAEIRPKPESVYDQIYGIWCQPLVPDRDNQGRWSSISPKPVSYVKANQILLQYKRAGNLSKSCTYSIRPRDSA